ncbi:MAG: dynamin family protein [Granulosicoccaceae bacterium]|jgi:hypothetical protein
MANQEILQQISAYSRWKEDLIREIGNYQEWLDDNQLGSPETDLRLYETLEALKSDHITVAFVAEVSRGKTELINTLFFSEYKRRLLPSQAGRTTMCPTELFYDHDNERPYIRLLPIESRSDDRSIAELKKEPVEWTHIHLDASSADAMAEAFAEVTRSKKVSVEKARQLGLYDEKDYEHLAEQDIPTTHIEIPMWRHALISFPHPLLEQGLIVLDTPGLNALGAEPELTLNMLPNAQAVLFLLSADAGVTKSDMEMWRHHVSAYRAAHKKGLLVVVNKIDTLWDELQDSDAIQATIQEQVQQSADALQLPVDNVFPVSAQKALLGRVKGDEDLVERSGIPALEHALSHDILPDKRHIISENIIGEISALIENDRQTLAARLDNVQKQQGELQNLCGKNADVIMHLLAKTREEQVIYNKNLEGLQKSKRILDNYSRQLLMQLDLTTLDNFVSETRKAMAGSWTTVGLKNGMKVFFDGVASTMQDASAQAAQIHKITRAVYHRFHKDHGFPDIKPRLFSTKKYEKELDLLYREADLFRKSPVTTMTEQNFVVKKFFISLVSKARNLFFKANKDADRWAKEVIAPLTRQVKTHKADIEKRLATLRKISESRDTLEGKIAELDKTRTDLEQQLSAISTMLDVINRPFAPSTDDKHGSRAAS